MTEAPVVIAGTPVVIAARNRRRGCRLRYRGDALA
jgi:hypothetical protein